MSLQPKKTFWGVLFSTLFLCCVAITTANADGRIHARILDGTNVPATNFPYVVMVLGTDWICSGTLISSRHVLTAAHCLYDEQNGGTVSPDVMSATLNGKTYSVSAVAIHPDYVSRASACNDGEPDAGVMTLSSAVSGVTPIPLLRSAVNVGETMLLVGYGVEGTGQSGETNTFPADGTVDYGTTTAESLSSTYISWTFDAGESNTGGGDSGGPAFVDRSGVRYVGGLTCGGTDNAGWGSESSDTRVDVVASWIDSITGGATAGDVPSFSGPFTATGTVGSAFSFAVETGGTTPITVKASGLPSGLAVHGHTISGTPRLAGTYKATLTATNAYGSARHSLVIKISNPPSSLRIRTATVHYESTDLSRRYLSLVAGLALNREIAVPGQRVTITIGTHRFQAVLGAKGAVTKGKSRLTIAGYSSKGRSSIGKTMTVNFSDRGADLLNALAALGFADPTTAVSDTPVTLPLKIAIGGVTTSASAQLYYYADQLIWH